jgi:ribulose-5-phosphate 4-epimerase/fuculose-1-phosphate aldolase
MQIDADAEKLTLGCWILAEQDIIDAYGHLSARVPGRDDLFIISRQTAPALVNPEDFIVMSLDGEVVQGEGIPNVEWPIHACVYRARSDVASLLHSHSLWSRIWGLAPIKLRGVLTGQAYEWNDGLAVYRDAGLIRTVERGDRVAATLGRASAMLLRGHGDVVVGRDVSSTVLRSITLKQNAQVVHAVIALGEPDYWSKDEASGWREQTGAAEEAPQPPIATPSRTWEYYEARVNGKLRKLLSQDSSE